MFFSKLVMELKHFSADKIVGVGYWVFWMDGGDICPFPFPETSEFSVHRLFPPKHIQLLIVPFEIICAIDYFSCITLRGFTFTLLAPFKKPPCILDEKF